MFLLATNGGDNHLILEVVFIFVMLFWLFVGIDWVGPDPVYRRVGGGLIPWVAVAILGYLMFS